MEEDARNKVFLRINRQLPAGSSMPRIRFGTGPLSTYGDGSGNLVTTFDLSAAMSEYYGRKISQGQVFKVRNVNLRLRNPNTLVQDNALSAAGGIAYVAPTGPRKRAWKNARSAVRRLRRMAGLTGKDYDFRVGLHPTWGEVVGQAWVRSESNTLNLLGDETDQNCIFSVWNAKNQPALPVDPDLNGFGFPFDTPWALGTGDMDFKEGLGGDAAYFTENRASQQTDNIEFQLGFAGGYDDAGSGGDWGAITNAESIDGEFNVMCGLMALTIDTTIPDDSELQTQDYEVVVTLDVEEWSPIK